MRKIQKQQLLDIYTSLHEMHKEISQKLDKKDFGTVEQGLSDCQVAAVQIGEAIEQMEGEGTLTVTYLEKYCDSVYELSTEIDTVKSQKAYKRLEEYLIKSENELRRIQERRETVFLPYKASMWDSLESVWKEAEADPNCDAYVIPIPYYDKNPDGSFKEVHYEADQYPKNVPITHYNDYDFEQHHPDQIYIHNPYDEFNNVTSVHPFFYSKNLKQFTDELVYIPYFVLQEVDPDNAAAVEGVEHFATTPAVLYADKVIVQSENMKKIYVNAMVKLLGEEYQPRSYWENKIFGTGSPKMDKVRNTKKEDVEVPKEWLKIIEKADGTWKKVIFYNTGLSALLQQDEKMLVKMQDVFRFFEEKKEDVALLWRPHPLIKATIESMRPHLWQEYEKIVEKYKADGWGIYDDTADLDRAIVLCDAYYGDGSSVVQLCQERKIPCMLQNVDVLQ